MKAPAFQFYPTDWLASQRVQMMTLEEEGAYIRLLGSCWQHGSVPADPEQAARLIGKGASTTLATTVLRMFVSGAEPGRMVHERLEQERQKQDAWREKSAAGGRKSAAIRAKSGTSKRSRVVEPPLQPNSNSPSSVSGLQSSDDSVWISALESGSTYRGIPVSTELGKCRVWCSANRRKLTRRTFVNWLNRVEKPVGYNSQTQFAGGFAPNVAVLVEPEPKGWREAFPDFLGLDLPWAKIEASSRAHICREMAKQTA